MAVGVSGLYLQPRAWPRVRLRLQDSIGIRLPVGSNLGKENAHLPPRSQPC